MSEGQFVKLVNSALKAGSVGRDGSRVEAERAVDVLQELEKFEVTESLLRKTSGGKLIKKLTKNSIPTISDAAKAVIKGWKTKVMKDDEQAEAEFMKTAFNARSESCSLDHVSAKNSETRVPGNSNTEMSSITKTTSMEISETTLSKKPSMTSSRTKDTNRGRGIVTTKLAQILEGEVMNIQDKEVNCTMTAQSIEKAIFEKIGDPLSAEYNKKFRSLFFNLKDPKNSQLRQRILKGEISGTQLVRLSSEELANDEKKRENDDIRKSKLRECERGVTQGATTDQFQCGKCKAKQCSYYQMQTRSADEPMTVYVTCTNCGNRWKC